MSGRNASISCDSHTLKCLQINLRHSKAASANLAQLILDRSLDIILIQEPYVFPGLPPSIANVPPGYSSFHALTNDHAYGAAVIVRDSLARLGKLVTKHHGNNAACVELRTKSGSFRYASVYLRPSLPDLLSTFVPVLSSLASPSTIFGVDGNAKHPMWNSRLLDRRGAELESLLVTYSLNVANRESSLLDFIPCDTAFVDVTLFGSGIDVSSWFFLSDASLSDHPYVYFEVGQAFFELPPPRSNGPAVPKATNVVLKFS